MRGRKGFTGPTVPLPTSQQASMITSSTSLPFCIHLLLSLVERAWARGDSTAILSIHQSLMNFGAENR